MSKITYLDYQATTPVDQEVLHAMLPYFSQSYGNPSSSHFYGIEALQVVEEAKSYVANFLEAKPYEIFFTSGSTEGNNLALKGVVRKKEASHIITVSTEHKSILDVCKQLETEGHSVTYLKPNPQGLIALEDMRKAINKNTIIISVMYGNNEIGTIQDIKEIGKIARENNVIFHCDATQGIGYEKIDVTDCGIDILTFSSHKIYGPKGIGIIFINNKLIDKKFISSEIQGGNQQRNMRSGTYNVPSIVGFSKAIELVKNNRDDNRINTLNLRHILLEKIMAETDCILNGSLQCRLPNNINVSLKGIDGQKFMEMISDRLAISNGSACNSGSQKPSYVLEAIGVPPNLIQSSFRISLGRPTTEEEVFECAETMISTYKKLYRIK
ncbi:MAG: cysteine desulfurase [Candidatus Paracaedimonas acanthamoebae]|uniref:Cysteine desulfurase n=1 Tax=Candidatus Paracaedimonas acanthamoebae TaxID=244581 RepID=A0A8J7TUU5_9PROT|nr:cysteine desulfurase [Candidatus Paracaedimonas acanthamoebae]